MRFPQVLLVISVVLSSLILQLQGSSRQDVATDITQAENFYYEARYREALTLLSSLDERLSNEGSPSDRARVKMLIGLNQVALGDLSQARSRFVEFCALDPNTVLDERQFPPKVVEIFKEARTECTESLAAVSDDARLQHGRELLAQEKYTEALREFKALLSIAPENEVLRQAVSMAQTQIDAEVQSTVSEWRTLFFSREFERAAASYEALRSLENEATGAAREAAVNVTAQYESTFQGLMTSWNSACASNDQVALTAIREWGRTLDPNRMIQPDALARMQCTTPPATNR